MILSPLDKRRSIGLAEAALVLGIPPRTLRRHAAEGAVPGAFRIGKRRSHWRFRTEFWNAGSSAKEGAEKTEVADNVTTHKPKGASPSRPVASD